jgi:hypothetical protein
MPYSSESIERMIEIKDLIKELVNEAQELLERDTMTYNRATSYWIPHILIDLDKEHSWLAQCVPCKIQLTKWKMTKTNQKNKS